MDVLERLDANPEERLTGLVYTWAYDDLPEVLWRCPGGLTLLRGPDAVLTVPLVWGTIVAAAPRSDSLVELCSTNRHGERVSFPSGAVPADLPAWAVPPVRALRAAPGRGVRLVLCQELPAPMGLLTGAESACAVALALRDMFGVALPSPTDPVEAACLQAKTGAALLSRPLGIVERVPFDLQAARFRLLIVDVGASGSPAGPVAGDPFAAAEALRSGDLTGLAKLLTDAHRPGDSACDLALAAACSAGALGGLAIGACVVALVPMAAVPEIRAEVIRRLDGVTRRPPRFLTATPTGTAHRVV